MKSYEITNTVIRLYINGNKVLTRPLGEAQSDPFIKAFMIEVING